MTAHQLQAKTKIVESLVGLRRELEESGVTVCEFVTPAVLLLADVCDALRLDERDRREILGEPALLWLEQWANAPVHVSRGPTAWAVVYPDRSEKGENR